MQGPSKHLLIIQMDYGFTSHAPHPDTSKPCHSSPNSFSHNKGHFCHATNCQTPHHPVITICLAAPLQFTVQSFNTVNTHKALHPPQTHKRDTATASRHQYTSTLSRLFRVMVVSATMPSKPLYSIWSQHQICLLAYDCLQEKLVLPFCRRHCVPQFRSRLATEMHKLIPL